MSLIELAESTIFDTLDAQGIILDSFSGRYFQLNPVATLMLETGTHAETFEDAVRDLSGQIEATTDQLEDGLRSLIDQLRIAKLLARPSQPPSSGGSAFAGQI